jgi:hypothetical protein
MITLSLKGYNVIMAGLSCYHVMMITLWSYIMITLWSYHDNVIMLSWQSCHVIIITLLCYHDNMLSIIFTENWTHWLYSWKCTLYFVSTPCHLLHEGLLSRYAWVLFIQAKLEALPLLIPPTHSLAHLSS